MTLYVDSSALIKRYVTEERREEAEAALISDPQWVTGIHTYVEVSLALRRRLSGAALDTAAAGFDDDWARTYIVGLDDSVCRRAVELGFTGESRTLDAFHLAAAERAGGRSIPIITFDVRLGRAARSLGFAVIGG